MRRWLLRRRANNTQHPNMARQTQVAIHQYLFPSVDIFLRLILQEASVFLHEIPHQNRKQHRLNVAREDLTVRRQRQHSRGVGPAGVAGTRRNNLAADARADFQRLSLCIEGADGFVAAITALQRIASERGLARSVAVTAPFPTCAELNEHLRKSRRERVGQFCGGWTLFCFSFPPRKRVHQYANLRQQAAGHVLTWANIFCAVVLDAVLCDR